MDGNRRPGMRKWGTTIVGSAASCILRKTFSVFLKVFVSRFDLIVCKRPSPTQFESELPGASVSLLIAPERVHPVVGATCAHPLLSAAADMRSALLGMRFRPPPLRCQSSNISSDAHSDSAGDTLSNVRHRSTLLLILVAVAYLFLPCSAVLRDISNAKEPYMAVLRRQVIPDGKTFLTSDFKSCEIHSVWIGLTHSSERVTLFCVTMATGSISAGGGWSGHQRKEIPSVVLQPIRVHNPLVTWDPAAFRRPGETRYYGDAYAKNFLFHSFTLFFFFSRLPSATPPFVYPGIFEASRRRCVGPPEGPGNCMTLIPSGHFAKFQQSFPCIVLPASLSGWRGQTIDLCKTTSRTFYLSTSGKASIHEIDCPSQNKKVSICVVVQAEQFLINFLIRESHRKREMKFSMYPPSTIAAASVGAAIQGLSARLDNKWASANDLVFRLHEITGVEPDCVRSCWEQIEEIIVNRLAAATAPLPLAMTTSHKLAEQQMDPQDLVQPDTPPTDVQDVLF
ncbi:hypothetical protein CEXT_380701 [Caerostris extrusa]|uniref:Cyclin C-terminal domain-containing protein n=1 Tax=Caerostris extrusa TaxID=172846 RepID=A0AAV4TN13_CAEEX|nr:hypothetical protein CEXT_380701 [Caerostris extrusa]